MDRATEGAAVGLDTLRLSLAVMAVVFAVSDLTLPSHETWMTVAILNAWAGIGGMAANRTRFAAMLVDILNLTLAYLAKPAFLYSARSLLIIFGVTSIAVLLTIHRPPAKSIST